jgi:histidinol phosphatase-like enzyme
MKDTLQKSGAEIDAIFYCPHYPRSKIKEYAIEVTAVNQRQA